MMGTVAASGRYAGGWRISDFSYNSSQTIAGGDVDIIADMYARNNDKDIYLLDTSTDKIYRYTMATAGNISTISYIQNSPVFTSGYTYSNVSKILFSPDGHKVFVVSYASAEFAALRLHVHSLTVAWDITTMSSSEVYSKEIKNTTNEIDLESGIGFSNDGLKLFIHHGTTATNSGKFLTTFTFDSAYNLNVNTVAVTEIISTVFSNLFSKMSILYLTSESRMVYLKSNRGYTRIRQWNNDLNSPLLDTLVDTKITHRQSFSGESTFYMVEKDQVSGEIEFNKFYKNQ